MSWSGLPSINGQVARRQISPWNTRDGASESHVNAKPPSNQATIEAASSARIQVSQSLLVPSRGSTVRV